MIEISSHPARSSAHCICGKSKDIYFFQKIDICRGDHTLFFAPPPNCCCAGEWRFLDVGFAPGGLSKFFLDEIEDSVGFGISLAFEKMGNPVSKEIDWMVFRKRYKYIMFFEIFALFSPCKK